MKTAIAAVLAAVLAGALGFYGGVQYQKSQTGSLPEGAIALRQGMANGELPEGFVPGQGMPGQNGGAQGNRPNARGFAGGITTGTVLAVDGKSVTVKVASGGSKTVFVSSSTQVGKQEALTVTDLKVGDNVAAIGEATDGGITARSIQVVPEGAEFRPGMGF